MSSMINTNIASLEAQRALNKSQDSLQTSLQRLSSGLRINSAKDDAAGLAISTRMTSQIDGMNQAIRNANDGISLAQTADSSLDEVTNNLQRIRDLAVQAANGSNSADDRAALDVEVQQRLAEVNRIATQTQFNGINLLDGSFSGQQFQIGANANQTVTISSIGSAQTKDLGLGAGSVSGTTLATSVATSGITNGALSINGTSVTTGATTTSAAALAAAINGNSTITGSGVTAKATNTLSAAFTAVTASGASISSNNANNQVTIDPATGLIASSGVTQGVWNQIIGASTTVAKDSSGVITTGTPAANTSHGLGIVDGDLVVNGISISGLQYSTTNSNIGTNLGNLSGTADTNYVDTSGAKMASYFNSTYGTSTGVTMTADATTTQALGSFTTVNTGTAANDFQFKLFTDSNTTGIDLTNGLAGTANSTITAAQLDTALHDTSNSTSTGSELAAAGITVVGSAASGNLQFVSSSGQTIKIQQYNSGTGSSGGFGGAGSTLGTANTDSWSQMSYSSGMTLSSKTGSVTITAPTVQSTSSSSPGYVGNGTVSAAMTPATQLLHTGFNEGTYNTVNTTGSTLSSSVVTGGIASGSLTINGVTIQTQTSSGVSPTNSAAALAQAINQQLGTTGVTATATTSSTGSTTFSGTTAYNATTIDATGGTGTNTYSLSVGGVQIYSASLNVGTSSAGHTSTLALTAADLDGSDKLSAAATAGGQTVTTSATGGLANSSVLANLAAAGITYTGSFANGDIKFYDASGNNIKVQEQVTQSTGAGTSAADLNTGTGFGFMTTLTGAANASSFSNASVRLSSSSVITVGGSNSSAAGLTAGTYGAQETYSLQVGDGTSTGGATLNFNLQGGTFGNSVKATDIVSAVNNSSTLKGLGITASIDTSGNVAFTAADGRNVTLQEWTQRNDSTGQPDAANALNPANFSVSGTAGFADSVAVATGPTSINGGLSNSNTGTSLNHFTGSNAGTYTLSVGGVSIVNQNAGAGSNPVQGSAGFTAANLMSNLNNATVKAALASAGITFTGDVGTNNNLEFFSSSGAPIQVEETTGAGWNGVSLLGSKTAGTSTVNFDSGASVVYDSGTNGTTHMGSVSLTSTGDLTIAGSSPTTAGLTAGSFGGANVLTVSAANATLTEVDAALKSISTTRASLGAYQNRFTSTVANLGANSDSLSAARSRILDTDFAAETANLSRGQILQQAGTAMLAQANQLPNGVLALLR